MIFKILPRKYLTVYDRYNRIGRMDISFIKGNIGSRIYIREFCYTNYSSIEWTRTYGRSLIVYSETLSISDI